MHTSYIHVLAFIFSIIDIHRFDFPRLVRGMGREGPKILEMFKFFTKFSWRDAEKVGLALGCPTRPTGTCPGQNVQFIARCWVWVHFECQISSRCVSVPISTGNMIFCFAFLAVNWCVHSFLVINKKNVWDSLTYASHGIRIFFVSFQKFVTWSFHHPSRHFRCESAHHRGEPTAGTHPQMPQVPQVAQRWRMKEERWGAGTNAK